MLLGLKAPDLAARRVTQHHATSRPGHGSRGSAASVPRRASFAKGGLPRSFTSLRTRGGVLTCASANLLKRTSAV